MKQIYKWGLLITLLLLLNGCQGDTIKEDETTVAVEEPVIKDEVEEKEETPVEETVVEEKVVVTPTFGGTLNIASYAPITLDPVSNDKQSVQQVLELIYEPLFELDNTLKPTPVLVESYTFEDQGKALKVTLKESITFHDETPLTTNDIAFTVEAIKDSAFSSYKKNVIPIKRITIEDDLNMTIYYDQGYAFALSDLTFPIVSETYVTGDTYDELIPIGTGAYIYSDYQQMQHLDLVANKLWHGGSVYVENIHCIIMNDDNAFETLFDQHLIDVMNPNKFNWLKYSENASHQIDGYTSSYYDFIGFNFNNEILADVGVRKAIAHGINKEFILYDRFVNHGVLADSPVIPNSWFKTDSELTYTYDYDLAKSYIPESLVDKDDDGFYDEQDVIDDTVYKTIELTLLVNQNNPLRVDMASFVQKDLEALGFMVVIEAEPADVYYERVENQDFDLLYGGWKLAQIPDYVALFDSNGSQNYFGYESSAMDMALENILDAYTEEQIIDAVTSFEALMIEDLPYVSMYFLEGAVMRHDTVYGEFRSNTESMFDGIEGIYLDLTKH